ncbi:GAF domain-containing protein, partial [Synechocystis salina LEGE 06155]|nr:GAF domain-containing protein [Synechocystis salina LEGE 06155]
MPSQIPNLEQQRQLVAEIALKIRQSLELPEILQTCVTELRMVLNGDRLLIYQFQPDWSGLIVAESLGVGIESALGNRIEDSCFQKWRDLTLRAEEPIIANDIYAMGYTPCHLQLLEQYGVTANLVQPIYVDEKLWGLIIAHHCSGVREWQPTAGLLLKELSVQLAIAIRQSNLITSLNQEIKDRKQLEQELNKIQTQYEKAQKLAQIGHWEQDLQSNNLYWSPQVFEILEVD